MTPLHVTISARDFVVLRERLIKTGAMHRSQTSSDVITFELDGLTYSTSKIASRNARTGGSEPVVLTVVEHAAHDRSAWQKAAMR